MENVRVYVVSGGTGFTGQQVLRACLSQFPANSVQIESRCGIRSADAIQEIVEAASECQAIVCHCLVDPELRQVLTGMALNLAIPCIDLLGPTIAVLAERLNLQPAGRAGLLYEIHKEELDRMDAVDFTMAHDDGNRLFDIDLAEAVLVGPSRVSKSVTCFYLASRGIRAANVPLVAEGPVPDELLRLDPHKVFGLSMNATHLSSIRRARLERIAGSRAVPDYADIRTLNREIRAADELYRQQGWTRIDVSYRATEEVASQIIDTLRPHAVHSKSSRP